MQCSMLDDFHQPSVVDGIEESTDVRVEYPVLCQNSAEAAARSAAASCGAEGIALSPVGSPSPIFRTTAGI